MSDDIETEKNYRLKEPTAWAQDGQKKCFSAGDVIALTERQAEYYRKNGMIEPDPVEVPEDGGND